MDIEALRLPETLPAETPMYISVPVEPRSKPALFLKGPVPLEWLAAAGRLPSKALQVAIIIWHRAGIARTNTVPVPTGLLTAFGVDRFAKRRALDALAGAGLITVQHHRGRNPVATINPFPPIDGAFHEKF